MLVYVLFIIGFALLIKSADILVSGASAIARALRLSDMVIGLTIVSFGTSMPELIVSVLSAVSANCWLQYCVTHATPVGLTNPTGGMVQQMKGIRLPDELCES